ncbi:MAG: peptide chain release factor N(5)-glutamine methyltransferase [Rhodospirillales bacterium]|nr:peptide chain release factor N(5)-glutamine methyltransferase [Rhodospirillales bacterium]
MNAATISGPTGSGPTGSGPARHVQRQIARRLAAAGIAEGMLEARLLIAEAVGCDALDLITGRAGVIDDAAARRLAELLARRLSREPIAYLRGEREFWSLPFMVTPDTLIPRADSETLVAAALAERTAAMAGRPLRVLDLGTGSGCLLLALLSEWPAAAGIGVDISEAALRVARANARRLGLDGRAAFVCSDWDSALADTRFDVIVSNPPYISEGEMLTLAPEVVNYEPRVALTAGMDGLAGYRRVLPAIGQRLAAGGWAVIEITATRLAGAIGLAASAGWDDVAVKHDLCGQPRCLLLAR